MIRKPLIIEGVCYICMPLTKSNTMRLFLLFILSLFYLFPLYAEKARREELEGMEVKAKNPALPAEERLKLYDELAWGYQGLSFEKERDYAMLGIKLAEQLNDHETKPHLYVALGTAYFLNSMKDSAALNFQKAFDLAQDTKDTRLLYMIHNAFGNLYSEMAQFDKSMEHYLTYLRLAKRHDDEINVCYSLVNIAVVYMQMENYDKAKDYLLEAQPIAEKLDDKNGLATIFLNLDEIYTKEGSPEKAIDYSKRAAELYHEIRYYPEEIQALLGVSRHYYMNYKDYPNALDYTSRAMEHAERIGFKFDIGLCHRMFCFIYYDMQLPKLAHEHALKALENLDSIDYHSIDVQAHLVKINMEIGNTAQAKASFDTYRQLILLYNNKEMQNALSEKEIKYESEKKDIQILSLSKEKKLYFVLALAGVSAILLLLITLFLLNRYQRQKRLRMKEKMTQLIQEKELIAAKSLLDGENAERGRLSHELHDGLGGLLTMIKLDLEQMKQTVSENEQRLNCVINLTDKSIHEMRRLAHNLMPESLARFGLRPVLEEFCDGNPQICFYFFGEERRFDTDIEINLYRIACELINNALKHAEASVINVQLIIGEDNISLTVQDNGKGFYQEAASQGLITVRSRAEFINASLQIYSEPGKGSEITVELRTSNITSHDPRNDS